MDDIVRAALEKWPNVPAVYGWLTLDSRGQWRIQGQRITHPAFIQFMQRNYECDARGAWFFQNGPQQVFVALEAAPYVVRYDGQTWILHTEEVMTRPDQAFWVEGGDIYFGFGAQLARLDDRDLGRVADCFYQANQQPLEAQPEAGAIFQVCTDAFIPLTGLSHTELLQRYRIDPNPQPPVQIS